VEGNHIEEVRLAFAAVHETNTDEVGGYHSAWRRLCEGLSHQLLEGNEITSGAAATRLKEEALAAMEDMHKRYEAMGTRPGTLRGLLDEFVDYLEIAEQALGLPCSEAVADLRRRRRASANRVVGKPFFVKHRQGIKAVWRRNARQWWYDRYLSKYGTEPTTDWWMENPQTATGGQVAPGYRHWFDRNDQAAFFVEMESRYRAEVGLPQRGEGWVSQAHLVQCIREALPGREVIREASPDWLSPQRLDIFVASLSLAIEYQGEQHFLPIDHFGGEPGSRVLPGGAAGCRRSRYTR